MSITPSLGGWVTRGYKSFHNPRAQQHERGEGRDFDAEDAEPEQSGRSVTRPLTEATDEGDCVQQKTEGKDAVAHNADAAETLAASMPGNVLRDAARST